MKLLLAFPDAFHGKYLGTFEGLAQPKQVLQSFFLLPSPSTRLNNRDLVGSHYPIFWYKPYSQKLDKLLNFYYRPCLIVFETLFC